ncbi:hypothetical protein FRC08_009728 [Ceratobasidium sp. 394]|nr:hypothetical protein FRC08_009728 [Ceratobasidium sp. 394]
MASGASTISTEKGSRTKRHSRAANRVIGVELPIVIDSTDSLPQSIEIQLQPPPRESLRDSTYKEPDEAILNPMPVPNAPMRVPAARLSRRANFPEGLNLPIILSDNTNNSSRQGPPPITMDAMPHPRNTTRVSTEYMPPPPQHFPESSLIAQSLPTPLAQQPLSPPPYTDTLPVYHAPRINRRGRNVTRPAPRNTDTSSSSDSNRSCFSFIYNYSALFSLVEFSVLNI